MALSVVRPVMTEVEAQRPCNPHAHPGSEKTLLRFITCGSVDDGKSTLIGRMLYENQALFDDQMTQLAADSRRYGTHGDELDFALLVDGLSAEREQGITIDVAYRFFQTPTRKFIVADTPGHEQYTRNMITGASTADVAVILIDARRGVLTQTRRHSFLVSLIGIRNIAVAINKMDLVDFSQEVFDRIEAEYREFAKRIGIESITCLPLSALRGDNVVERSPNTPWYEGPTLMGYLNGVHVEERATDLPFRLPVQWVNRPSPDFRGFSGLIASGAIHPGDRVRALPSGKESRVARIVTQDGDLPHAIAGQSVTLTLADEIDISRGDIIVRAEAPAEVADQFSATLVWMSEQPLVPNREYLLKIGARTVLATPGAPEHKVNVNTLEQLPAPTLALNEIGVLDIALDRPVAFDPYERNRETGAFILIDRLTSDTVAAGMIRHAQRRTRNVRWQPTDIDKQARAALKGQTPRLVWFTGLSGAGKSTIANLVEAKLYAAGKHTYLLDGDNVRHGLNRDLGFSEAERVENIRRVAEVGKLMVDAGLIVLASFISPYRAERDLARSLLAPGEFVEVFVDTPLAVAEQRDVKGLYSRARAGQIANFTGIDAPYEAPENPELRIDTEATPAEEAADAIVQYIASRNAPEPDSP